MLTGYNHDFVVRGRRYHIQTEDDGIERSTITSLLFHRGRILEKLNCSYSELLITALEEGRFKRAVGKMMLAQHKALYQRLVRGDYESLVASPAKAVG